MGRYPSWNQTGGYGEPKVWGSLRRLGGKGSPGKGGKPYLDTLWGNGMSMCMLLSRDCARRGSSYSTIHYGGPSRRLMRYRLTDIREMCWAGSLILGCRALVALTRLPLCSLMNQQSPTYATKFTQDYEKGREVFIFRTHQHANDHTKQPGQKWDGKTDHTNVTGTVQLTALAPYRSVIVKRPRDLLCIAVSPPATDGARWSCCRYRLVSRRRAMPSAIGL